MKEKTGKACRELNREQLLENLNHLIGWQGLTYAELENAAGIYPGYISRMKSDPRKLPALDVIWKIAQVLGVPIEWLIEGTSGELDREILYLRGFLQRLFDLTVEGRLSWHGTPLAQMMEVLEGKMDPAGLPFFEKGQDGAPRLVSKAFPGFLVLPGNTAFSTAMNEREILCLTSLHIQDRDAFPESEGTFENEWLEMQLWNPGTGERTLVACSSYGGNDLMWADLRKLYQQLLEHETDLRLSPALRTSIDAFLARWE